MRQRYIISIAFLLLSVAISVCPAGEYEGHSWLETEPLVNGTLACEPGKIGNYFRLCKNDSTWEDSVISTCTFPSCVEDTVDGITYPVTVGNSTVTIVCAAGSTGSKTRFCTTSGSWESPTGTCTESGNSCPVDSDAGIEWPATAGGVTVSSNCSVGFGGNIYRVCSLAGEWSASVNNCTRLMCEEFTDDSHHIWPETPAGGSAAVPCAEGVSGTYNKTCLITGIWDTEVHDYCASNQKCPILEEDGYTWPESVVGTVYSVNCKVGFSGMLNRTCLDTKIWGPSVGTCERKKCPRDTDTDGVVYKETNSGEQITANCPVGKSGSKTRQCSVEGVWKSPVGNCMELSCPQNVDGYLTWPITLAATEYALDCPAGMKGPAKRLCNAEGNWEDVNSFCEGTVCSADDQWPVTPANMPSERPCTGGKSGKIIRVCMMDGTWSSVYDQCVFKKCEKNVVDGISWPETNAGVTATSPCSDVMVGEFSRECGSNGKWKDPTTTCVRAKCDASILDARSGSYSVEAMLPGDLTLPCNSGYNGTVLGSCSAAFEWRPLEDHCQQVGCPAQAKNGVDYPETPFETTVTASCSPGKSGTVSVTCSSEGTWNEPIGECIQMHCLTESLDGYEWPEQDANTVSTLNCKGADEIGQATRMCKADATWEPVSEASCVPREPSSLKYAGTKTAICGFPMEEAKPTVVGKVKEYIVASGDCLPVGIELDRLTGTLSGTPLINGDYRFGVVARNAGGETKATVSLTVNSNVCEKEDRWYAMFVNGEVSYKCKLLGKETRKCEVQGVTAVWGKVNSQCMMMTSILVACIIVVVLVLLLVLILVLKNASGGMTYDRKKAQRKIVELACV